MRVLSGFEMTVSYLLIIGIVMLLRLKGVGDPTALVVLAISLTLILVVALVVCNVGTLYRMRYASWQILNGLGLVGWGLWLEARREARSSNAN